MLKKELEETIRNLRVTLQRERDIRGILEKEIKLLKLYSSSTNITVMTIALEKITEAMAHTIQSVGSRR